MKSTDRKEFLDVVLGFAELKGKQLSTPALELYWRAMQHWPLAEFKAAAEQLLRTSEFMPVPKDFEDLRKASRMTAGEAFAIAQGIARNCSAYCETTSDDPFIDAAARACGGYRAMGMVETDKIGFLERRFAEHYEAIAEREDIREALPQIAGPSRARLNGPRHMGAIQIGAERYDGEA